MPDHTTPPSYTGDVPAKDGANIFVRVWRWYENTVSGWCAALAHANGALGVAIVRRPIWTIVLSLVVVALCAAGWARLTMENDSTMWVPRTSKAKDDKAWVEAHYGLSSNGAQAVFSLQPQWQGAAGVFGGNNVVQLATTWEMFLVDAAIHAINVSVDGRAYTYADICYVYPATGSCNAGYLNYWNTSLSYYLAKVGGSASDKTQGNRTILINNINNFTQPDGSYANPISTFAPLVMSSNPARIVGAAVIAVGYTVSSAVPKSVSDEWYNAYTDLMKGAGAALGLEYIHLDFIASNSVGKEIGRSVTKDFSLIAISVVVFFIVAILGISKFDWVETRSSLAVVGVSGAVLALVAGYGLAMLMGQPFTSLAEVLPYILLGVTVDVMFILVKGMGEITAKEPYLTQEQRFFKLMAGPGLSCAIVLLASAVAFALGATAVLPAMTWFSVYACLATVAILFVQLTFFIAVFVLTERRIAASRRDCCCCSVRPSPPPSTSSGPVSESLAGCPARPVRPASRLASDRPIGEGSESHWVRQSNDNSLALAEGMSPRNDECTAPLQMAINMDPTDGDENSTDTPRKGAAGVATNEQRNAGGSRDFVKVAFEKYYAPVLLYWPVRIFVLLTFVALCVLSGVAISHLERGQPISDLAPTDSYLIPYDEITTNTFAHQSGSVVKLYFRGLDWRQPAEQGNVLRALTAVQASPFINATLSSFQSNWLIDFIDWVAVNSSSSITAEGGCANPYVGTTSGVLANYSNPQPIAGCVDAASFYTLFRQWLLLPKNARKSTNFVFSQVPNSSPPVYIIAATFFSAIEAASMGAGSYNGDYIRSFRDLETSINGHLLAAENQGRDAHNQAFFMYEGNFNFAEGDAALPAMAEEYAIMALCGVGFVMIFVLVNPVAVLLMMIAVGMVNLFLYGEMYVLGIRFNQVSVINMVMATGLAVDYSVYWAQKFMTTTADGTRAGRTTVALAETGSAVFLGGVTALLGSLPLAFSSSTILKTFFKLLWGTIIFALVIGLIFVPVVFSIIGPAPLWKLAAALEHKHGNDASEEDGPPATPRKASREHLTAPTDPKS